MSAPWVHAACEFHQNWFPSGEGSRVQTFWFGARKKTMRPFFDRIIEQFEEPLKLAIQAATLRPFCVGAVGAGWPSQALLRVRLKLAIFLDQMCRNIASVRGDDQAADIRELRSACDAMAIPLALSIVADVGGPDQGSHLLALASPAEICFLSLILRHSRDPLYISVSLRILESMSDELSRRGNDRPNPNVDDTKRALELCSRFIIETRDAVTAVKVEEYLTRALTTDEPLPLVGPPADSRPRLSVLDARCQRKCVIEDLRDANQEAFTETFVDAFADPDRLQILSQDPLVETLRASLDDLGFLNTSSGIVLSLSGGVDSMVTCCLLALLQRKLPQEQRFRWCALHLCHPNRSDATDEEGWVRIVCDRIGIDLLTYRLQIRRPHGDLRTGISRERYEEKSKELRFRMYARCLARMGIDASKGAALVAHHQDDADENRLAELGKGNILHIDGMSARGTMLGVEVIRPLLAVRKAELIKFSELANVCYMQDSTPRWSRRGWTRCLLDDIGEQDSTRHERLLAALTRAGSSSEAWGNTLDESLHGWKQNSIVPRKIIVPALGGTGETEVAVVFLWLPEILHIVGQFEGSLTSLCHEFKDIAEAWNAAIAVHAPNGQPSAKQTGIPADDGQEGLEDDGEASGSTCPLQKINVGHSPPSAGPFLLGRAICAALNESSEVDRLLRGQLASRKALTHLWDSIARARREYQWGALHKRCPCLCLRDEQCIVLCDDEGREAEFTDKNWQKSFALSAIRLAREYMERAD